MSTDALITFKHDGEVFANITKHSDGFPDHLGKILHRFLADTKLVQGLSPVLEFNKGHANGAGDLVAQFIAKVKTKPGDWYIRSSLDDGCGYNYHYIVSIRGATGPISVRVLSEGELLFYGNVKEFGAYCDID